MHEYFFFFKVKCWGITLFVLYYAWVYLFHKLQQMYSIFVLLLSFFFMSWISSHLLPIRHKVDTTFTSLFVSAALLGKIHCTNIFFNLISSICHSLSCQLCLRFISERKWKGLPFNICSAGMSCLIKWPDGGTLKVQWADTVACVSATFPSPAGGEHAQSTSVTRQLVLLLMLRLYRFGLQSNINRWVFVFALTSVM